MEPLFFSAAIILTIVFLFFGASSIRSFFEKASDKNEKVKRHVKLIKPTMLGGLGAIGWIIFSIAALWGSLLYWQVALAIIVFGSCLFIHRKYQKKDTTAESLRFQLAEMQIRIRELSKSYDVLKQETAESVDVISGVSNHRDIILAALKHAQSRIIILSGWLTDWVSSPQVQYHS